MIGFYQKARNKSYSLNNIYNIEFTCNNTDCIVCTEAKKQREAVRALLHWCR